MRPSGSPDRHCWAASGPLFALWIAAPHGPRLRPGDMAIVRMNQPVRAGDLVVVLRDKRVAALGEFGQSNDGLPFLAGGSGCGTVTSPDTEMLKIACLVMP